MNVYEEIKSLNSSKYSCLFARAEACRAEICQKIFDKKRIISFCRGNDIISEENLDLVTEAIDEILCDDAYTSLSVAMYHFMKNDIRPDMLKPPRDKSLKSEFALVPPMVICMAEFVEESMARGVSEDILITTLRAVNMYINSNQRRSGVKGTSGYHDWLPRYAMGKLFRLGAFQFELCHYDGEDLISVHIPRGTELNREKNMANFRYALEFFEKYYPAYDFKKFVCYSWLMNPYVEQIMGKPTNISRFGDMFTRFELEEEEIGVYINVFKIPEPIPTEELPEDTSLQRNIKNYMKAGNVFRDYGGYIPVEEVRKS